MAGAPSGAYDRVLLSYSFTVSGNDLSAATDQFIFVKPGNAENTVVPAAAADVPMGVSQGTGKNGEGISVGLVGITKVRLAGTVKRGNLLKVYTGANDGRAVVCLNDDPYGGMALRDGAANAVIPMLLTIGVAS